MFVRRGVRFFATECKRKTTTWDPLHSLDLNHQSLVLLEKCNSRHQFKQILANIMRVNLICDTFPMSRLILFSAITYPDNIDLAKLLFRNFTPNPNVFVYNTMISSALSKKECFGLYGSMVRHGVCPDRQTFLYLMKVTNFLSEVKQIHCHVTVSGVLSEGNNYYLWNSLVKLYMELGGLGYAEKVFDEMPERDVSSFNTMIVGYAKKGYCLEAMKLYYKMVGDGIEPDEYAVLGLLVCCGRLSDVRLGKGVHGWIERRKPGSSSNLILWNAVLDMYFKCRDSGFAKRVFDVMTKKDTCSWNTMVGGFVKLEDMEAAREVFDQMPRRDLVSWNSLLLGYSKKGCDQRVVRELVYEMLIVEKVVPDGVTFVSLISGAANNGELSQGRWAHGFMIRLGLQIDAFLGSALVDIACRGGEDIETAEMALTELLKLEPDKEGGYVLLSNIYAAARRFGYSDKTREAMESRGVKKVAGYSSVVGVEGAHSFVATERQNHPRWLEIRGILHHLCEEMSSNLDLIHL
ncbi:hypothetical protein HID58_068954 [Brassica napus]|uniref:Pentatricopeptide repeat-containing protein n=1 Tax=Brassica napus TaxID=3708 RepID=A0ABQ7ZNI6_BRANA|nr:hypothetical protein HID58_068954 [Brassica napus]